MYVVLEEMLQKGYAAKALKGKKVIYAAQNPQVLLGELNTKESLLANILGELAALSASPKTRPRIKVYEGIAEISRMYEEILRGSEVRFFSSLRAVKKYFHDFIAPFLNNPTLHVKDILVDDPINYKYVSEATGPNYQARFMPSSVNCTIDLAIWGNKVAISSIKQELFSVVIESEEIATSLRSLHELLWNMLPPGEIRK